MGQSTFFALLLWLRIKNKAHKGIEPIYILTQTGQLENCEDTTFRVEAASLEEAYINAGYQRYERVYQIRYQHKEYTIICPEFRNDADGRLPVVIIPEFLIPRRPYPIYVYLYVIDLYSANPEKGQRWAAEATRKYFGLETFAHTTLGRALKAFVHSLEIAQKATESLGAEATENGENTGQEKTTKECARQNCKQSGKIGFFSTGTTETLRKQAAQLLNGSLIRSGLLKCIEIGKALAREWFKEYGRFLM